MYTHKVFALKKTLPAHFLALSCIVPATALAGITDLGKLNGGLYSDASAISGDGTVVVGGANDGAVGNAQRAFKWTQASGMVSLGTLSGGNFSYASAVNGDGSVIVGDANIGGGGSPVRAFRWTQAGGMVNLGVIGTVYSSSASNATGVSSDGSVVVGQSTFDMVGVNNRAFRWTQAGGMVDLGTLPGGNDSRAAAVNSDGTVVVGSSNATGTGSNTHAFRWTQAGGMVSLGTLAGGTHSYARGVNSDGSVVVGGANIGGAGSDTAAFRWTQSTGMVNLGFLGAGNFSQANAVSGDGSVVVGLAMIDTAYTHRAFRWTQATGIQSVEDWLRANGVTVPVDITAGANGVSADGSVVVGSLNSGSSFLARVGGAGNGLVTFEDIEKSLSASAQAGSMALSVASTVINGAHSRPLARRAGTDKKIFWVAGDVGNDDHGARSGDMGLAEIGGGLNLGPVQLNLSVGHTWAEQKLDLGGKAKTKGTYLMAEALVPLTNKLWATFSGYGHRGDADLRRGYLNAGVQDASTGDPDVNTWGLRARLDWDSAFTLAAASISPYVDLSYSVAKIDAYTETGGGFPAQFNSRKERATDLRIGMNLSHPITNQWRLLGTLEAAHRFEDDSANTTGQLIGLFGFNLPGADLKQNWLRAGLGVEGEVATGTASLMLNVTTRGEVPNAWLAASWQKAF